MEILFCYMDFLKKSFDANGRVSRKSFWSTLIVNAALAVLLVSVGLALPKGRPLQIYIAFSAVISTPLVPPFITIILRRLNDIGKSRLYALLLLLPFCVGVIPVLLLCARESIYGTEDDFSAYQSLNKKVSIVSGILKNVMTVYPFIYLIYIICKLVLHSGVTGANVALLSINLAICVMTLAGFFKPGILQAIPFIDILNKLTALSNAMITIMLYQETQNFFEATVIVYLFFYVMINPAILAYDLFKLIRHNRTDKKD